MPPSEDAPAIACEHLTFSYRGSRPAISDVNLRIGQGDYVSIVGENGAGKSTFALLALGLLAPTAGTMRCFVIPTDDEARRFELRSRIGMVFQNPDDALVASVVEDEVAFGPENLGFTQEEVAARVEEALETCGLTALRKHETSSLSGGQKQRLAIAGVLAMSPSAIIFDEAASMLDPEGRRSLLTTIDALHAAGTTIINITHDMEEAARAERVIVFDQGTIRAQGTPLAVLSDEELLASCGLEPPLAGRIRSHLLAKGVSLPPCVTIDELVEAIAC